MERDDPDHYSSKDSPHFMLSSMQWLFSGSKRVHTGYMHTDSSYILCMVEHELLRREGHSKGATNRVLPVVTCRLTRESVMACRRRPTILTSPYGARINASLKERVECMTSAQTKCMLFQNV